MLQLPTTAVVFPTGAYLNEGMWQYVSQKGDMEALLLKVKNFCPNATLSVPPGMFPIRVISLDGGVTDLWAIQGTVEINGAMYTICETGGLVDRITQPNPFIDKNPDTSVGGPTLKYRIVAGPDPVGGYPGVVECYWNK